VARAKVVDGEPEPLESQPRGDVNHLDRVTGSRTEIIPATLKANGIRVVLASVLPVYTYSWRPEVVQPAQTIVARNQWMKDYARNDRKVYFDYHSSMVDERPGLREDLSPDGVHPNEAGYRVMAPLTVSAIQEALRK
jgi:lysophospholipase L1-like esterase